MKVSKKVQEEQKPDHNSIHALIKEAYSDLERKYSESNNKREANLLKNYINVLDRVSDQLIYAQEKFFSVDIDKMRDEKCLKYATEISNYRAECFDLKDQIKKAKAKLEVEEAKGDKLKQETNNLRKLYGKKEKDVSELKNTLTKIGAKKPKSPSKIENNSKFSDLGVFQQSPTMNLSFKRMPDSNLQESPAGRNKRDKLASKTRASTFRERFNPKKLTEIFGAELPIQY